MGSLFTQDQWDGEGVGPVAGNVRVGPLDPSILEPISDLDMELPILAQCAQLGAIVAECIVKHCPGLDLDRIATVAAHEVYLATQDTMMAGQVEHEGQAR